MTNTQLTTERHKGDTNEKTEKCIFVTELF